ncbi:ATP-binding protein [Candidimonas nitroreducens]|uniref:Serine/threonine protein kinase n=1 Tax=Candidimonas nitroreducens TaxID=683354 RepID=A0A225MM85_9BURK|nr:ATP-binding protein [Candidimonas nitroreducens]OWT62082.1 serine/threonine protein kinase [Candidimonas nitroreducens]
MQTLASLTLTPGPDAVTQALGWLETVGEQARWPTRTTFKLSLCLDEALSNIVMYGFKHAAGDSGTGVIRLAVHQDAQHVLLDLYDNGVPYDPTQQMPRDLDSSIEDAEIGGHGLRLMRHYLLDIQYQHTGAENHLRMTAASETEAGRA